jgi:hypothetical protein
MRIGRALLITALVIASSRDTLAVCVNGHPSVDQEFRQSSLVFVGRVTAISTVPRAKSFDEGTRYTIQVKEIFRGRPRRTLTVFSENSSGRFPMDIRIDYLLFLSVRAGEPAMVDSCGNSGPVMETAPAIDTVKRLSRRRQ